MSMEDRHSSEHQCGARLRSPESPTSRVIAVIGKRHILRASKVIEQGHIHGNPATARVPEARYTYYRRCQVFRKGGVQCKAPAEKGAHICYAHAREQAMAFRRKLELTILLAEVAQRMRVQGKPDFEIADIFTDFNAIQVTLGVMAQALIDGRIDCKTAGRLLVGLQTASKLLWMIHRKRTSTTGARRHGEQRESKRICADECGLSKEKDSTTKDAHSTPLSQPQGRSGQATEYKVAVEEESANNWAAGEHAEAGITVMRKMVAFADIRGRPHGPPGWARAA